MDEKLDKKLVTECPRLFKDRYAPMNVTAMCWGFDCGDGWFKLIYEASKKIEAIIEKLPEEKKQFYYATQVKEKYGTLRFYMSGETEEIEKIINKAEAKSAKTCEICGKKGKSREYGTWLSTLCDECDDKHSKGLK